MRTHRASICFLFAVQLAVAGQAAPTAHFDPKGAAVHDGFVRRIFSPEQGLPAKSVRGVLPSRSGYLWAATAAGLARFDGLQFRLFNRNTHFEFVSDDCTALAETAEGTIWIGTRKGVLTFHDGRVIRHGKMNGIPEGQVRALCVRRSGEVWAAVDDAAYFFRGESWELAHRVPPNPTGGVLFIREDSTKALWFSDVKGLRRWNDSTQTSEVASSLFQLEPEFHSHHADKALALWEDFRLSPWANDFAETSNGTLVFAGTDLWEVRKNRLRPLCLGAACTANKVLSDSDDNIWISVSGQELWRWHRGAVTRISLSEDFNPGVINAMREDAEGSIWFATEEGGLECWQSRRIQTYMSRDGLAGDSIYALAESRDGSLWIGTETGLSQFRGERFTNHIHSDRRRNIVRALAEDAEGDLWIGTLGYGVDCYRDGRFTNHPLPGELAGNKVRAMTVGREGALWIGTAGGLHLLRHGQIASFNTTNGLPHNEISALHEDRAERLWVGTEGGGLIVLDLPALGVPPSGGMNSHRTNGTNGLHGNLGLPAERRPDRGGQNSDIFGRSVPAAGEVARAPDRLKPGLRTFATTNGLPSDRVWALHEDAEGILWVGTERGLARLDMPRLGNMTASVVANGAGGNRAPVFNRNQSLLTSAPTIATFAKAQGLYEEAINEIIEDDFGRLWLASDRGIMRVGKGQLTAVAEGRTNRVDCVVYSESDGLLSGECSGQRSQPAACKTRDGRLWFATTKGVAIIDPRKLDELDTRPPVLIERVVVDGEKIFENLSHFQPPVLG